ncbi:MAG: hypothetical protein U0V70_05225 [Terriglobia bacterium]
MLGLWILLVMFQGRVDAQAEQQEDENGPLLFSVSPLMGKRGSTIQTEVRGARLEGSYAVWFDRSGVKGKVLGVEEIKDEAKPRYNPLEKLKINGPYYRVQIELQIDALAGPGQYPLRLVSPRGLSNPIRFPVTEGTVTVEATTAHGTADQAQSFPIPGFIIGKIGAPGELDFYTFQARRGQELSFRGVEGQKYGGGMSTGKFSPELIVYRSGGSWFDTHRLSRVLSEEDRFSDLIQANSKKIYVIPEDGQYFLQISGKFGQGCPDCTYQVQVSAAQTGAELMAMGDPQKSAWTERTLSRVVGNPWMESLEARAVTGVNTSVAVKEVSTTQGNRSGTTLERETSAIPAVPTPATVAVVRESDDHDVSQKLLSVPVILEGTIEKPGDLDRFKIKVAPGQKLAFELETPEAKPPIFNPRMGLVDSQNRELFSNVERRLSMYNNNADPQVYLKAVESKAIYTFEQGGEYALEVRDITSRYGDSRYRYRILVRPEIPHVGEISLYYPPTGDAANADVVKGVEVTRVNLERGTGKKLIVVAAFEEGFAGDLSFSFTGLPEGVKAFPAVQAYEERAPLEVTQNPEIIAPKQKKIAIALIASAEAPLTREPRLVRLHCQTIANGQLGPDLLVREIPLMVIEGAGAKQGGGAVARQVTKE